MIDAHHPRGGPHLLAIPGRGLHLADHAGLIVVAPASTGSTWDIVAGRRYGPDLALADAAFGFAFARCAVDPARLAVGGFSDGASYALSPGLNNGDVFTHVRGLRAAGHPLTYREFEGEHNRAGCRRAVGGGQAGEG